MESMHMCGREKRFTVCSGRNLFVATCSGVCISAVKTICDFLLVIESRERLLLNCFLKCSHDLT